MKMPLTDLGSPAILVIDMQRDFVDAGAPIECPGARAIIPDIARLLDVARERQLPIIYTEERHRHDGIDLEISNSEPPHCLEGTSGIELVPLLRPRPADYIVAKRRYSGFFATDLDLLLRSLVVRRGGAGIAVNLGRQPRALRLDGNILLSSSPALKTVDGGVLVLPADSVVIVSS